jgi:hypothetical protein
MCRPQWLGASGGRPSEAMSIDLVVQRPGSRLFDLDSKALVKASQLVTARSLLLRLGSAAGDIELTLLGYGVSPY